MVDKQCAFYIRVSSEKQASVEEGSLKNQEQMLNAFITMKNSIGDDDWHVIGVYIDRGKSAKDTKRPEYQRMIADISAGKVNAVICTALSRISRSTRDLLDMVDFFKRAEIDFICLKEQFDTTTAQGKCFLTIMGALNEFEREQTSERTRGNMLERAKRGLWQGGQILGYDLDQRKGYLTVNEKEAALVNFLFDAYLECGSVERTAMIANNHGFHGKVYTTKKDKKHPGQAFVYSSVLKILTNLAYVGIREWNKGNKHAKQDDLPDDQKYAEFPAVWKPIIDKERFYKTQKLLRLNCQHKNNGAKPSKHNYVFNGGLLACHKCGARMEGRNGHGKRNKIYYYYYCTNRDCGHKVPELELEEAVSKMVEGMASQPVMLNKISDNLNESQRRQLPKLKECRRKLIEDLAKVKAEAGQVIGLNDIGNGGRVFVEEKLAELAARRGNLEAAIEESARAVQNLENESISESQVRRLLTKFAEVFRHHMKPYEKRTILKWILEKIRIGATALKIGIDVDKFKSDITQILRCNMVPEVAGGSYLIKKAISFLMAFFIK